jgi:hypothetical protein
MTAVQRAWLAIAVLGALVAATVFRYELVVGSRGDGFPPAYRLDRWTGKIQYVMQRYTWPVDFIEAAGKPEQ